MLCKRWRRQQQKTEQADGRVKARFDLVVCNRVISAPGEECCQSVHYLHKGEPRCKECVEAEKKANGRRERRRKREDGGQAVEASSAPAPATLPMAAGMSVAEAESHLLDDDNEPAPSSAQAGPSVPPDPLPAQVVVVDDDDSVVIVSESTWEERDNMLRRKAIKID